MPKYALKKSRSKKTRFPYWNKIKLTANKEYVFATNSGRIFIMKPTRIGKGKFIKINLTDLHDSLGLKEQNRVANKSSKWPWDIMSSAVNSMTLLGEL